MLTDSVTITNQPSGDHPMTSAENQPEPDPARDKPADGEPRLTPPTASHQVELFETQPPPWELAVQEDVALASVVFSQAPHGPYDYRIPDSMRADLQPGMRVKVPLGRRKRPVTGWCIETKQGSAGQRTLRDVAELVDADPLCDPPLVRPGHLDESLLSGLTWSGL